MNNLNENDEIPSLPVTHEGSERGSGPSRGANTVDTIAREFQQFMWTHGITTLSNAERQRLFERLATMQPPDIEVPARGNGAGNGNASNISLIENDDTVGELPNFQNPQTNPRGDGTSGPTAQPRGFAIDPNATPVASGGRNPYFQPGTPYPGTPGTRPNYIGTPVGSQGGFFPTAPSVPSYAGYQEPIPTSYAPDNMKSSVPRLKKDDTESYLVFTRKFRTNLIFLNLGHVTDERYMKSMLPTS